LKVATRTPAALPGGRCGYARERVAAGYAPPVPDTEQDDQQALREALKRAGVALKRAGVPFAVAGGYAAWARGGPEPDHDADLVLLPSAAADAERALVDAGLEVVHPPEDWLFKAFADGAMVDVVLEVTGVPVSQELLDRADVVDVLSVHLPVLSATDVLVTKLGALSEQACDYGKVLPVARALREQVDWGRLVAEVGDHPYAASCVDLLRRLGVAPV
jgi:hypothetical protein